jgi:serine/threonine-protein kinase
MNGPHTVRDIVQERYEIIHFIGKGGMQFVYKAKDLLLGREVALKTPQNNSALKRFERSAVVSAKVNHPNVAKTIDYIEAKERPYLIEELIVGEDLEQALLTRAKQLDPYLVARVFHHLVKGLAASHHVRVIHRDIKPANIMVEGGYQISAIKITDFGIAKMAEEVINEAVEKGEDSISASSTAVGALPYMAPEAITDPKSVDESADVWSVGALVYTLLTGNKPYGTGLKAVAKIVEARPPEFPAFLTSKAQFKLLVQDLRKLIELCLQKEPSKRPTADTLVEECGKLCYPIATRQFGIVRKLLYSGGTCGFIASEGDDVFFHQESVFGQASTVSVGDHVMFSRFPGGGAARAHPVVRMEIGASNK